MSASKVRVRSVVRMQFTKAHTRYLESREEEQFVVLESQYNKLCTLDEVILEECLENNGDIEQEICRADEYKQLFLEAQVIFNRQARASEGEESVVSGGLREKTSSTSKSSQYKLAKLQLTVFDLSVRNWQQFWGQLQDIDACENLSCNEKMQYLLQTLLKGSKARKIAENYPPNAESYKKAVNELKSRFGRDSIQIEVYIRDILSLVINKLSVNNLCELFDKLTGHLNALESLGVTSSKYAAMLLPLVESSLPIETLTAWERFQVLQRPLGVPEQSEESEDNSFSDKLRRLMEFMRGEVEASERMNIVTQSFNELSETKKKRCPDTKRESSNEATAAGLLSSTRDEEERCLFCDNKHSSKDCRKAVNMTWEERQKRVQDSGRCFLCLKGKHLAKFCSVKVNCSGCGKRHLKIMCRASSAKTLLATGGSVLLQTLKAILKVGNKSKTIRVLIDTGSDTTYVRKATMDQLKAQKKGVRVMRHSLFGGTETSPIEHSEYDVTIQNSEGSNNVKMRVVDQDTICSSPPRSADKKIIDSLRLQGITLSDIDNSEIELLIGSDYIPKILTGQTRRISENLVATNTILGWTLMGAVGGGSESSGITAITLKSTEVRPNGKLLADLWELDTLGIKDPSEVVSKEDAERAVQQKFLETISTNTEGRYEVELPWREGHPTLGSNWNTAEGRLRNLTRSLSKRGIMKTYENVLQTWETEKVIEEVKEFSRDEGHYLPHLAVVRDCSSTFKVRPVFDASAKDNNGLCLNACLEKGPNTIERIPSLINRFRWGKFGLTADIKQAFVQIAVKEKDRDNLRFIWCDEDSSIKVYRHCRVVFGLVCSPFLLEATIKYHLSLVENTELAQTMSHSFYVDNLVVSVDTEEEVMSLVRSATDIMKEGCFDLRGWRFTGEKPGESPDVGLLGITWNVEEDTLQTDISSMYLKPLPRLTRRVILSVAQRLFDPIGYLSPISIIPKLILQETWTRKLSWDEELPEDLKKKFMSWYESCWCLRDVKIPRWTRGVNKEHSSLHVFSDASKTAYSACVFLRTETEEGTFVSLIQARSRVTPLRPCTIPRLELMGALIGVRLAKEVRESLNLSIPITYWCDSTVVIWWIKEEEPWSTFVGNRVKEIRCFTKPSQWRFIKGQFNAADLPSRGCNGEILKESKWWEGPTWLKLSKESWPSTETTTDMEAVNNEKRNRSLLQHEAIPLFSESLIFEKFEKTVRVISWILRFSNNCKSNTVKRTELLTSEELSNAQILLLQLMQRESFGTDKSIKNMETFTDMNGIIRLKTRLCPNPTLDYFKCPMLLDGAHPLTYRLLAEKHKKLLHAGVGMMMSNVREEYWIIKCRQVCRKIVRNCVICKRFSKKTIKVSEGCLPEDRITATSEVFEVTGIDLAGPMGTRNGKAWIVLFTCAVFRAIHLEVVQSLSTEALLRAIRRFIARRGRPKKIYADNGTNLVGANNALSSVDWKLIEEGLNEITRIEFHHSPPVTPWWGGFFERLFSIIKGLLRRVLGRAVLSYEELETVVLDCESVINQRALTYMSEDEQELVPLTPALFLHPLRNTNVADIDEVDRNSLSRRARYLQELRNQLRSRFRDEYLGQLGIKTKLHKEEQLIQVGDVVIIASESEKRFKWPMARVLELFMGRDGKERVARLKAQNGELIRPVQRLVHLEVADPTQRRELLDRREELAEDDGRKEEQVASSDGDTQDVPLEVPHAVTTRGRRINKPTRFR